MKNLPNYSPSYSPNNNIKKSIFLTMSSVILGLSLSIFATNALAVGEEVATDKLAEERVESQPVANTETGDTATEDTTYNAVKSATPPMSDITFTGVSSLRDGVELGSGNAAAAIKLLPSDSPPIARNYFQQPPLIPHRIREYKITVRNNKCMTCHSWKTYKKARATKVSQTHFADRDGNAGSTLAARRYFCTQCHVPQVDAKPLVENDFKPVSELNK